MSYAVLTYDAPHRKTQDLLLQLKASGYDDILVLATPWVERKNLVPLIPHRPPTISDAGPLQMTERLGYRYQASCSDDLAQHLKNEGASLALISGAGILGKDIVDSCKVINSHPGYLPYVRGLDALKWAIHDGLPIGVTVHVASEEPDAGWLIKQELVPIYNGDTFPSVAYRQYEMEIAFLVEAIGIVQSGKVLPVLATGSHPVHRRMPHQLEDSLLDRFNLLVSQEEIPNEFQLNK